MAEQFYILDTCAIYSYCKEYLELFLDKENTFTLDALSLIDKALNGSISDIKIIIPNVVFIEIFDKYLGDPEFTNKFKYEFYLPIIKGEDVKVHVAPIDKEIIDNIFDCYIDDDNADLHDKLILSTSLKYKNQNVVLFSSDSKIKKIITKNRLGIRVAS